MVIHGLLGLVVWRVPLSPSAGDANLPPRFDERVMLLDDLPSLANLTPDLATSPTDSPAPALTTLGSPVALAPIPGPAIAAVPTPPRRIELGDPDAKSAPTPNFLSSQRDGEHNAPLASTNQAQLSRERDTSGDGRPVSPAITPQASSPQSSPSAFVPPTPSPSALPTTPAANIAPTPGAAAPSPTPSTAPLSVTSAPVAQPVVPVTGIKSPTRPGEEDATREQDATSPPRGEPGQRDARATPGERDPRPIPTVPAAPLSSPEPQRDTPQRSTPSQASSPGQSPGAMAPVSPTPPSKPPAAAPPVTAPPEGVKDPASGVAPGETRPEIRPRDERTEASPAKTDTSITGGATARPTTKPATDAPVGETTTPAPTPSTSPPTPATDAAPANATANAPATPPSPAAPDATAKPAAPGAEPGTGGSPTARPGDASNREADATSTVRRSGTYRNGRIDVGQGLEIRTARPNLTLLARASTAPRAPLAEVYFDRTGTVVDVKLVESSGYPVEIDEPVRTALYRWRARGATLDELPDSPDARVVINIRVFLF